MTLPGLRNATAFVVITTTIASFRLFTQVDVMTQGGPIDNATSTVVFHAIRVGFKGLSLGYASAISFVFFLIVVTITLRPPPRAARATGGGMMDAEGQSPHPLGVLSRARSAVPHLHLRRLMIVWAAFALMPDRLHVRVGLQADRAHLPRPAVRRIRSRRCSRPR